MKVDELQAGPELDAKAWQRLSRLFNEKADLQDERDREINEFLKKQIGQAVKMESCI
jgi:hypothetical protein